MENLDGTVIATALPQMGQSFHVSPVDLNIGMTAYMLTLAVFIPISGWIADRLGARTVFISAIAIFTASSVLCGLSHGIWEFTMARVAQGIGGSMMVPVGRLVVLHNTEKRDLMRSMAYITWPGLAAPVLGPVLGGFITTYASWHWIFFLNVPLGIAGIALASLWIVNQPADHVRPFDWTGFALSSTACTSFMYGLELIGRQYIPWRAACLCVGAGTVLGVLAVLHIRRTPHPILNFMSLKIKTYAVSIVGGSVFRVAISVSPFLLPLMFQVGFGLNAFQSGLLVFALFAGNFSMKSVTTPILRRCGFRSTLLVNGVATSAAILACAFITPHTPRISILGILFVNGLCRSMQFTSVNTLAFVDVPKARLSSASTLASMAQQMSMGMGVAVSAIALRLAALFTGHEGANPTIAQFHIAFVLVATIALVAVLDCVPLDPHAGAEVSGHRIAEFESARTLNASED